jgi:hypothetical protein
MEVKQRYVLVKGNTGRDVQHARNGTWDVMIEKKESETEEPVRRLGTSNGTWDIMREKKESETEEPVRRWRRATKPGI